jgi:intracellular septation protein
MRIQSRDQDRRSYMNQHSTPQISKTQDKPPINPLLKLTLDLGPLVLFFIANSKLGIFGATAVFMAATVIALVAGYALTRHVPVMPLVSAIVVLIFGSLTLYLQDETFIKIKPTIIYLLFGAVLLGGQLMGKPLLAMVFDQVFHLNPEGWRKLTVRWVFFFFALAILNEIVWRTQSTDTWVAFKVFGFIPLTFIFAALQYPLLQKYAVKETTS